MRRNTEIPLWLEWLLLAVLMALAICAVAAATRAQPVSPLVQACIPGCVSGAVTEVNTYSLPASVPVPNSGAVPAGTPQVFPVTTPVPAPTGITDPACQGADACYVVGTPAPQMGPGRWVAYARNAYNVSDPSNTESRFRPTPARLE